MSTGGTDAPGGARVSRRRALAGGALSAAVLLAGCAAADKDHPAADAASTSSGTGTSSGSSGMSGMDMGTSANASANVPAVNGFKPVASQLLARTEWQHMQVEARTMTPTPFVIYDGDGSESLVKPPKDASFHLMVMLSDARTGVPIPYSSVWATIRERGKIRYDDRQWPMLSAFMGPHYGNNVALPGAGQYQLTLLVSPPVSARHLEYRYVWTTPHQVTVGFHWKPTP